MPATCTAELLALTLKEFDKLARLIGSMDARTALQKDHEGISAKDIIAHRAHWIDLFLGWYRDGQAGKDVYFPAKGYKWNALKRYNADLRQRQADIDWPGAIALLTVAQEKLLAFIAVCSEDDLYGGPMKGGKNHWTPGRWAEAAGPSHYRSAAKYLRAVQKGQTQ